MLLIATLLVGAVFASALFEKEVKEGKRVVGEASRRTKEKQAMLAYAGGCRFIKAYRNVQEARDHRHVLTAGKVVYLPNGEEYTVQKGLHDVEVEGWWYSFLGR